MTDIDPNPTGDWQEIACPYCGAENTELWDGPYQFDHEDGDSVECTHCGEEFVCKTPEDYGRLEARRKPEGYLCARARFLRSRDRLRKELADHVLEVVTLDTDLQAFYLKREGSGRMMSTLIIFSPEGITLIGDLVPCRHGCNSALGYGLRWFSDELSPDYLQEKFPDVVRYSNDHGLLCAIQEAFARERRKAT